MLIQKIRSELRGTTGFELLKTSLLKKIENFLDKRVLQIHALNTQEIASKQEK